MHAWGLCSWRNFFIWFSDLKEEFELPQIPSELPTFEGTVQFGAEMKAKHFHLDVSLNPVLVYMISV